MYDASEHAAGYAFLTKDYTDEGRTKELAGTDPATSVRRGLFSDATGIRRTCSCNLRNKKPIIRNTDKLVFFKQYTTLTLKTLRPDTSVALCLPPLAWRRETTT